MIIFLSAPERQSSNRVDVLNSLILLISFFFFFGGGSADLRIEHTP